MPHHATRIAKLLRLLASPIDGEVLSAARALRRVLAECGSDLHAVASVVERHWHPPEVIDLFHQHGGSKPWWQALAGELIQHARDPRVVFGERERSFLQNMIRLETEPTALQSKWLRDVARRRRACA